MNQIIKNNSKNKIILSLLICLLGLATVIGTSYAFFQININSQKTNSITAGVFEVKFASGGNAINLTNTYPMTESEGKTTDPFVFTVNNNGTIASNYTINLIEEKGTTLNKNLLKYTLKKNNEPESAPKFLTSLTLVSDQILNPSSKDTYSLKIWLDESATNDAQGKIWKGKVSITAVEKQN